MDQSEAIATDGRIRRGDETRRAVLRRAVDLTDRDRVDAAVRQAVDALGGHVKAANASKPFPDSAPLIAQLKELTNSMRPGTTPTPFSVPANAPLLESAAAPESELPPRWLVTLRVATHSAQPGVRGFLAYKRLSSLGNLFRCTPSIDEVKAKLEELLKDKVLNLPDADIARHFPYGGKIKRVYVSADPLKLLNAGELGVLQLNGRYVLVTAAVLAEAEAVFAPSVALKVDPDASAEADPYADPLYQVPDDLVW